MITRYTIGNPIETESVITDIPLDKGDIPFWTRKDDEKSLSISLAEDARVFGLGETIRGINKRGWVYDSNCTDDPVHSEDKHSLYAAQNFFIISSSEQTFGTYIDTPGKVRFDIGYTEMDRFAIRFEDFDADIYIIQAPGMVDIVKEFRKIIGKSYIPPKWAFGFGQSRWSYMTADEVREVADKYEEAGIPIDSIYLDIDYMERFKDFTINAEAFPNFEEFVSEMKNRDIHLVPIIDAGVKIEDGYDVYEEGVEKDYFCKKEDGERLVAAVWPGRVHFPDFLDENARKWFGEKYKILIDKGIDGFWNDMNEPAIFYTEDHLSEVFEKIDDYKGKNLDIHDFFDFKDLTGSISNNAEDYKRFYHNYHGKKIRHDKVHNIFGYNMTRAAGEAFDRLCPDRRILMFSRSSYIGMHRYGGVWCGDNMSWWSHLLLNIQQMPALNMCGFLYCGADIGGFGADTTEDLMMRWTEFGIFTPLFRNHSALGTRRQELYRFKNIPAFKKMIELRYALIPYLYSEFMKAAQENDMLFKPLSFEYPTDKDAFEVEDQLLVGESIMIAPIYKQNARGRYVYLPEDMKMLRFRAYNDYDEDNMTVGHHYIKTSLEEVLVFVRKGHVLPMAEPAVRAMKVDDTNLNYITFDTTPDTYRLYKDDGVSR
ncbi:glycoside hydrolase family 31 protein [Butyrivibrio sp. AE3004]|uniref:glycoside hydrolase family 31 protein n=1 Tax=Butyrivibrio sp. AE3004 TaxID=1506994 RepID=UPI00049410BE|nr:TIM-barrel domain-containing protein [Butyrivibrio sp. AE3004]